MKRSIDVVGSGLVLVVLSPVILAVCVAIRMAMGRPVIFRQTRLGRSEETFTILKFRTMADVRDEAGRLLPDSDRISPVGAFLRRSSLDEVPELVNVLKGEMSLVGPRPLIPEYRGYFTQRERARFAVRPGVTGLAQVSGRNSANWDERLEADAVYVERMSTRLDLAILLRTVVAVLGRTGVHVDPSADMADLDEERRVVRTVDQ